MAKGGALRGRFNTANDNAKLRQGQRQQSQSHQAWEAAKARDERIAVTRRPVEGLTRDMASSHHAERRTLAIWQGEQSDRRKTEIKARCNPAIQETKAEIAASSKRFALPFPSCYVTHLKDCFRQTRYEDSHCPDTSSYL